MASIESGKAVIMRLASCVNAIARFPIESDVGSDRDPLAIEFDYQIKSVSLTPRQKKKAGQTQTNAWLVVDWEYKVNGTHPNGGVDDVSTTLTMDVDGEVTEEAIHAWSNS